MEHLAALTRNEEAFNVKHGLQIVPGKEQGAEKSK